MQYQQQLRIIRALEISFWKIIPNVLGIHEMENQPLVGAIVYSVRYWNV